MEKQTEVCTGRPTRRYSQCGRRGKVACVLTLFGLVMLVMGSIVHIEKSAVKAQHRVEFEASTAAQHIDVTYAYIAGNALLSLGAVFLLLSVFQACCCCCCDDENRDTNTDTSFDNTPSIFSVSMTIDPPHYSDVTKYDVPPRYCDVIDETVEKRGDSIKPVEP